MDGLLSNVLGLFQILHFVENIISENFTICPFYVTTIYINN